MFQVRKVSLRRQSWALSTMRSAPDVATHASMMAASPGAPLFAAAAAPLAVTVRSTVPTATFAARERLSRFTSLPPNTGRWTDARDHSSAPDRPDAWRSDPTVTDHSAKSLPSPTTIWAPRFSTSRTCAPRRAIENLRAQMTPSICGAGFSLAASPSAHRFASRMRLSGVSAARRNRVKPACSKTSRRRASPAWAPSPSPTSCDSEFGVQMPEDAV